MDQASKTRTATLHRLTRRVRPDASSMWAEYTRYFTEEELTARGASWKLDLMVGGASAIWIGLPGTVDRADWCSAAAVTTGLDLAYDDCRSGGVLLIGVDDTAYAMSYGTGYMLIPGQLKDRRFGMSFAVRRLDPRRVADVVRRRPDGRGRTDSTLVASGAPIISFGIAENTDIIRRLGGKADDLKTTFGARDKREVTVEGAAGLRTRYAIDPTKLIADIREVERVCREETPHAAFEFVDHVQPVTDPDAISDLDDQLEILLGWDTGVVEDYLIPVVPSSVLKQYQAARSHTVKIGSAIFVQRDSLTLDEVLRRTRLQDEGQRLATLRRGWVSLNSDTDGSQQIARADADHWIEASVDLGARRFTLLDGEWYEIGAEYVRTSRDAIASLFPAAPSIALPAWSLSARETERAYNFRVADGNPGAFLCLDRNSDVRSPLGARSSLEMCDLLGPDNELIHVKQACGSEPLSHLFFQGLVSAETLTASASAREQFTDTVRRKGRVLPASFRPTKVVYAILLKKGTPLTADTLFPFSQASLAHAARTLRMYHIDVEVIGIPAA